MENDLRGNENWFELKGVRVSGVRVSEGLSYRESTVVVLCSQFHLECVYTRTALRYPSCRHTTWPSLMSQPLSDTRPHTPPNFTSILPALELLDPRSRTLPSTKETKTQQ